MPRLVEVTRGDLVESFHNGVISLVHPDGRELTCLGDSKRVTFFRSSAKPIQALPLITSGAFDKYGFTLRELAVMTASHSGEKQHVETVRKILEKIGVREEALLCGVHPPYHKPSALEIYRRGEEPTPIHVNCSGKHSAMLALCRYYDWPIEDYIREEHPVQQLMLDVISEVLEYPRQRIKTGIDGCGVVVFGIPIWKMAHGYAKLASPSYLPEKYQDAARLVVRAMQTYPEMVGGTDRLCTDLMKVTGRKLVAKAGAEAVYCVGILEKDLGLAVKIDDGSSRGMGAVVIEALKQLGLLTAEELQELSQHHRRKVKNHHRMEVGEIRPAFKLDYQLEKD